MNITWGAMTLVDSLWLLYSLDDKNRDKDLVKIAPLEEQDRSQWVIKKVLIWEHANLDSLNCKYQVIQAQWDLAFNNDFKNCLLKV